jgi:CDP-diacylglycerol--serine O-phosphatidyltransferase
MLGFLFTLFAALRLAKFNVDTRQSDSFVGLATPAATIFVVGVYSIFDRNSFGLFDILNTPYVVLFVLATLCFLMIAEIPMFSFKLKNKKWSDNKLQFSFIGLAVILLILLKVVALPLIIFIYVLVSITQKLIKI